MKKIGIFICALAISLAAHSQKEIAGYSPKKYVSVTKEVKPPILAMKNLEFTDSDGNNCIDAAETCYISFDVANTGYGDGMNLSVQLNTKSSISGISFKAETPINPIKKDETQSIKIPINGTMNTANGTAQFSVKVDEPNGFGTNAYELDVKTRAFQAPLVKVNDYTVTSSTSGVLAKKQPFDLQLLVQNIQYGLAEDVNITLKLPAGVILLSGNGSLNYNSVKAGEKKDIVYSLIVGDNFSGNALDIMVDISEKFGKYAEDKSINLELNQAMEQNKIVVDANVEEQGEIKIASLTADVDKNIPMSSATKSNSYALIIGNEDYTKYQPGLTDESNVLYARNDAKIFRDYCRRTLGIPKENITLLTDAISSSIKREIERFVNNAKYGNGQAELIFYFSGHGFPYDKNKDGNSDGSYIMPVDISSTNVTDGIALTELYAKLTTYPAKKITVFMDACFSGGGRQEGLLAAKAVRYKAKEEPVKGNLVVFSASKDSQESLFYNEKGHGLFTYFLLKKLQQTKGDISYQQLFDYLKNEVPRTASDKYYKEQNPQVVFGKEIQESWGNWKLK